MKKVIADLCWGESVAVRKAFLMQTPGTPIQFRLEDLLKMDYTPFHGDPKLIQDTAWIIKRQTGMTYKHIFLTNGASGGCAIALRACAQSGSVGVGITNPPPYFSLYPSMMRAAGLYHATTQEEFRKYTGWRSVFLLDSPSNPKGNHEPVPDWASKSLVVWDAVYHNWVYSSVVPEPPRHDIVVGSFSKLTGLNGIRMGWIATNDDHLASIVGPLISAEYCGLSRADAAIMGRLLGRMNQEPYINWSRFEGVARYELDGNREEWAKLEKYFDGTPVSPNGMFHYARMDTAAKALFEKSGVLWQSGSNCGTSDEFGRFNIGQDPKLIREAVKSVIKTDKR